MFPPIRLKKAHMAAYFKSLSIMEMDRLTNYHEGVLHLAEYGQSLAGRHEICGFISANLVQLQTINDNVFNK